jgi:hypothetical protein
MVIMEESKHRTEYKREYYEFNGNLRSVEVDKKSVEDMITKQEVWRTTKWLCEQKEHGCARLDFTRMAIATKVAKRVLTQSERDKLVERGVKDREVMSYETNDAIMRYVFKCWKEFEKYNMLTFTKVKYTRTFRRGRRYRQTYTYRETAVKLTEKGEGVVV